MRWLGRRRVPLALVVIIGLLALIIRPSVLRPARAQPSGPVPDQTQYADFYPDNPMVHQVGRTLVDGSGNQVRLRGVNVSGWLQWEGFLFGKGELVSETQIINRLRTLSSQSDVDTFMTGIYDNFITEADFARIAELGFNTVRVPFNRRLLSDDDTPFQYKDSGWVYLDQAVTWAGRYGLYIIFDYHSLPGAQSGFGPADPPDGKAHLWSDGTSQSRVVNDWSQIAARYADNPTVVGYDLVNEPQPPTGTDLVNLDSQVIAGIRQVDPYHMVFVEGGDLARDFGIFDAPLSGNMAYSPHIYNWFGDDRRKWLSEWRSVAERQNVPFWVGEFGENRYDFIQSTVAMFEDPSNDIVGWTFFNWKRAPTKYPPLYLITVPDRWNNVMDFVARVVALGSRPSKADTAAAMAEFVTAVRLENNQLDDQTRQALVAGWLSQ